MILMLWFGDIFRRQKNHLLNKCMDSQGHNNCSLNAMTFLVNHSLSLSFPGSNINMIAMNMDVVLTQTFPSTSTNVAWLPLHTWRTFSQFTNSLSFQIHYLANTMHAKFVPVAFLETEPQTLGNINLMETWQLPIFN